MGSCICVKLYSDRKPRACQKVGKYPAPGQRKLLQMPHPGPGTEKAGKCTPVAWGRGREGWAQLELTDVLPSYEISFKILLIFILFFSLLTFMALWVSNFAVTTFI